MTFFTLDNCFLRSLKRFHLHLSSSFDIFQGSRSTYLVNKIDRDIAAYWSAFIFVLCQLVYH